MDVTILPSTFPYPMVNLTQPNPSVSSIKDKPVPRTAPPRRPTKMPFEPVPENVPKLKKYILDQFASSTFNRSAPFPEMKTPPARIHLKPDAIPYARHTPIPIPHHWKADIKKGLDDDVKKGIIKPVDFDTSVE